MTQEELAELCNVNIAYIHSLEAGNVFPSAQVLENLCKGLKVGRGDLFREEEGEIILNSKKLEKKLEKELAEEITGTVKKVFKKLTGK